MNGKNPNTNYLKRQRKEHLKKNKRAKESVNVIIQIKYRVPKRNQTLTQL